MGAILPAVALLLLAAPIFPGSLADSAWEADIHILNYFYGPRTAVLYRPFRIDGLPLPGPEDLSLLFSSAVLPEGGEYAHRSFDGDRPLTHIWSGTHTRYDAGQFGALFGTPLPLSGSGLLSLDYGDANVAGTPVASHQFYGSAEVRPTGKLTVGGMALKADRGYTPQGWYLLERLWLGVDDLGRVEGLRGKTSGGAGVHEFSGGALSALAGPLSAVGLLLYETYGADSLYSGTADVRLNRGAGFLEGGAVWREEAVLSGALGMEGRWGAVEAGREAFLPPLWAEVGAEPLGYWYGSLQWDGFGQTLRLRALTGEYLRRGWAWARVRGYALEGGMSGVVRAAGPLFLSYGGRWTESHSDNSLVQPRGVGLPGAIEYSAWLSPTLDLWGYDYALRATASVPVVWLGEPVNRAWSEFRFALTFYDAFTVAAEAVNLSNDVINTGGDDWPRTDWRFWAAVRLVD